ncbi:uncharacterized protein LOC119389650 isoform X2 [Rhipicephalus sanguineus]|uniref:uncharacterized protein LOC119389650 isoform X2 n=1 Tax=Rhipicephalus sanguineus TaxID=34632 RepID=UPI0020C55E0D|nr:uncharacterized protein LOC119389650 isoform X2 [Rhipicephalus sanguineus]
MAGRSVRVISLGDPNDVACMDEGVRVIAVNPSGQQSMGPSCQSSLTKVFCGPVETIGMPAPPKTKGSRLDWRITPEGGLEVTVGRPLTKEEEEKRERDRKSKAAGAASAAAPADAAAGAAGAAGAAHAAAPAAAPAAPADAAVPPAGIDKLRKQICDPLSLLANKRLPICFETTLGKETAPGLTSVTVINEQPGSPVMVQPRAAPVRSSRGFSPPGVQVICSSDGGYGGYQSPTVKTCSAMGGCGGNFTGMRIRADSSSSMGRRCEQLLPDPCPAMQTIRIVDDVGAANRRTSSRVVHIFEEPPAPPRSTRGSSRDRQVSARVVHIEEDCPDFP